ncbi:hypothetical protein VAS14_19151 [Vibrio angustum S14]|uniref:Uncharacterized protein n=1 Tax=Photobacterium angustum (strain S14 / CCUG 15956) TaxID=314292 RepID=Q1ZKJ1_PHOAS|nr:hypothetical protein VAS14_19151 [Vibrio angustum S14] [Photobacterium angustum S14]
MAQAQHHAAVDDVGGKRNLYPLGSDDPRLRSLSDHVGHHAYQKQLLLLVRALFPGTMLLR